VSTFLRSSFPTMGTVASIVMSDESGIHAERANEACEAARASLARDEQRFSHYRSNSDISRWSSGMPVSPDSKKEIEEVLSRCAELHADSGGAFCFTNPITGELDTAGYVKGFAIARAVQSIRAVGVPDFVINVGGDSFNSGRASRERPWHVAIANPTLSHGIVEIVEAEDLAVATSGTAERGEHIWKVRDHELLSFTVVGPKIDLADAYATIGFAMGESGIDWVSGHDGYRCIAIRADGSILNNAALVS
jgi:thiamine biosynthesis lipoprotein